VRKDCLPVLRKQIIYFGVPGAEKQTKHNIDSDRGSKIPSHFQTIVCDLSEHSPLYSNPGPLLNCYG
jgi:hypothetical protein